MVTGSGFDGDTWLERFAIIGTWHLNGSERDCDQVYYGFVQKTTNKPGGKARAKAGNARIF